jgi:hypothetical protein
MHFNGDISPHNYHKILYDVEDYIGCGQTNGLIIKEVSENINKASAIIDSPIYNYVRMEK